MDRDIIFRYLDYLPYFIGSVFILIIVSNIVVAILSSRKYKKIPDLNLYLTENKDCETNQGIKCKHCNSRSIRNFGLRNANDTDRLHICNSCGKTLYRSNMTYV